MGSTGVAVGTGVGSSTTGSGVGLGAGVLVGIGEGVGTGVNVGAGTGRVSGLWSAVTAFTTEAGSEPESAWLRTVKTAMALAAMATPTANTATLVERGESSIFLITSDKAIEGVPLPEWSATSSEQCIGRRRGRSSALPSAPSQLDNNNRKCPKMSHHVTNSPLFHHPHPFDKLTMNVSQHIPSALSVPSAVNPQTHTVIPANAGIHPPPLRSPW